MGIRLIHLEPAAKSSPGQVEHRENRVARHDQVHDLSAMGLPRGQEPLGPASKFGLTPKRPGLRNLGREDDLALGVEEGEDRVDIRSVPGFNQSGHDLDARPRHRPLSIAREFVFRSSCDAPRALRGGCVDVSVPASRAEL